MAGLTKGPQPNRPTLTKRQNLTQEQQAQFSVEYISLKYLFFLNQLFMIYFCSCFQHFLTVKNIGLQTLTRWWPAWAGLPLTPCPALLYKCAIVLEKDEVCVPMAGCYVA